MIKQFFVLFTLLSPSLVMAGSMDVSCRGSTNGLAIRIEVHVDDITDFNSGSGSIYLNGSESSHFDGQEVNVSLFSQSMSGSNSQGDVFSAHFTDINQGYGVLDQLHVPGYHVNLSNLPLECWMRQ